MDHPPGANRTEWWLQVAVQPVGPGWQPGRPPAGEGPVRGRRSGIVETPPTSDLFDLTVFELDRRCAAENGHRHLEAGPGIVDFLDDAVEGGEGAV